MKRIKITKANDVKGYLEEVTGRSLEELLDTSGTYNVDKLDVVSDKLNNAAKKGTFITFVGDYDSDGINSLAILIFIAQKIGAKFKVRIPKRNSEGYGFSLPIAAEIPDNSLVVCIDNGIVAFDAISEVKRRGCEVIVIDHHAKGETLPEADIIIDPEAIGGADFTHYCGAGLAYKLAVYMFGENSDVALKALPYATIGTIGDVVSLTGDNRKIVKQGIQAIKNGGGTVGLQTLCRMNGVNEVTTATDIAFSIVPILNAPGRLEDNGAVKALAPIILDFGFDEMLSELIATNTLRKDLTNAIVKSLDIDSLRDNDNKCVVLYYEKMIPGLAGIIAGKLAEETRKPSIVFTGSGEIKGSARNPIDELNLIETLRNTGLLIEGGGHPGAAGLSIKQEDLNLLISTFDKLIGEQIPVINTEKVIEYNLEVEGKDVPAVSTDIFSLQPFGEGFPEPVLRVSDDIVSIKWMGSNKQHLRITCNGYNIIAFNTEVNADLVIKAKKVRAIGTISQNYFNGNVSLQLKAKDVEFF